ncbi:DUF6011 domain-containing protein [Streptomyces sp. NPDC050738]|uniref:DUF6011 domain-containing protein n=1 Tax=Streptomyces sp. NPDC050738 TaxID=3154744 RepID=UPI00341E3B52
MSDLYPADVAPPVDIGCGMCGRPLTDPISRATGIGPVCHAKHHPRPGHRRPPSSDQLALPAPETTMPIRHFTREQLDAIGVPSELGGANCATELADEIIGARRWTEVHRLIFRAPDDGIAYSVEYEAGSTENQEGIEPFHQHGQTVPAVAVEQRPVTVMQWLPVQDAR